MLPNFLIVGAAKAGTTSLYHYVRAHPQSFMPERKELSFFCEEFNWARGIEWYERHFDAAGSAVAVGEASPRYTVYPIYRGVPARIAASLPDVRLIYVVREPVQRMRSHYVDRIIHGIEEQPIEEALLNDPFYLSSSSYTLQMKQYLEHFSRDQMLIITSEDLRRDRSGVLSRVFGFLGIDPAWRSKVFEEEFLPTDTRRAPRGGFRRIWYSPITHRIAPFLPETLKDRFRSATSRSIDEGHVTVTPSLRKRLEERLRDDVSGLYDIIDDPRFDGWGIA
jgi:hypothetical protein